MIVESDTEFHPRDPNDRIWTETTYVAFHVPEANLLGTIYVLARPNAGVAMSSVVVARGMRRRQYEIDFCDPQIHLPCPASYSKFDLENGLSLEARSLTDWHFQYEHKLGNCSLDLELKALHHPFDPSDPDQTPLAKKADKGKLDPRVGDAWSNGHFDIKAHITGELTLNGKRYAVDCFDGMDRSWGPRNETPDRATSYISVNMGEDLGMWLTMLLKFGEDGEVIYDRILSGFIVEHGRITPVVDARVEATTVEMLATGDHIVVTDANGRTLEFFGTAICTRPLGSFNPSIAAFISLMRYHWGDKVGYGGHGKLYGLSYLAKNLPHRGI
ncbi:MAG: hypothetical protein H6883_05700 [Rhodobiaceae bacterium]|nr:hypothetical protein [Rhodobiaceae bacterium]MCC0055611.1 hypothetical protein [Rhodobiaceae bacterium]